MNEFLPTFIRNRTYLHTHIYSKNIAIKIPFIVTNFWHEIERFNFSFDNVSILMHKPTVFFQRLT